MDSLLQYVNQMTGMQRLKTGDVDPSYGRIPVIDSLLASFKQYDESSLNELDRALESVSEAIPSRRVYMSIAKKVREKGADYIAGERERMEKFIKGDNILKAKKSFFRLRRNVLDAFMKEVDETDL